MILIIFDVDGTLVYSERRDSRSFAATYELLYGRPFPTIDWHYFPHVTDTTIFGTLIREHFQRDHTESEVEYFQQFYLSRLDENRRLRPRHYCEVPGARDTWERLCRDKNFVLGVATGGWSRPARIKLAHVGITTEPHLLSGADGKATRDDILQEVIDRARHTYGRFERIVYVGDAGWDVVTTRRMQLNFVGIRYQHDLHLLQQAGASHVLPNYQDFDAFLQAVHEATTPIPEKSNE